jgi:phosphatidylserine/phosphatidylglycerophosphate/cardiolipin synthase-like enzyme
VEGSPLTQGTSYWSNAPYVGVHHQKILIVYGTEGLVVFQGGMDIREDRLHFPGPKAPWGLHDVQTRVRGTAAHALWKVFMERWSDHPSSAAYPGIFVQPSILPKIKADLQVEVGRTYPNCAKHPLYPNNASYSFAPNGERSARAMVLNAISQSKRFIYIEDQYLFDMSISDALKAALPNISKLIILINEAAYTRDQRQTCYRRKLFIDNLTGGKQPPTDKVIVCQNRVTDKADERVPFVHSKTFIFDDKFAIVGSANINRRGYTHDSEQSVGIFDTNKKKKFFFAHELRMNLWAKLLALRPIDLVDPIASSVHWSSPTGHIMTYTVDQQDPPLKFPENLVPKDVLWDQGLDPDGS